MELELLDGNTPLSLEETRGLIPAHIATQAALNAFEQQNIAQGQRWALKYIKQPSRMLANVKFIQKLHRQLFNQTWRWAGKFWQSDKNLGIAWFEIPTALQTLCDDVQSQLHHQSYTLEECAVRFHHRLVWIHPFANGNRRLSRLIADLMML